MNEVFVVISALVNALILGFISRRLLGVPVGWPRTIVVSLLVSWTFGGIVQLIGRIPGVELDIQTRGSDLTAVHRGQEGVNLRSTPSRPCSSSSWAWPGPSPWGWRSW